MQERYLCLIQYIKKHRLIKIKPEIPHRCEIYISVTVKAKESTSSLLTRHGETRAKQSNHMFQQPINKKT